MKYKVGDKVVVEIIRVDAEGGFYCADKFGNAWIGEDYVLGKLSDFQQQEKIRFTKAEKDEFDKLASYFNTLWSILYCIENYRDSRYPNLYNRLFHSGSTSENAAAQLKFAKAIEHPELIEVEKEKEYYIKILGQYLIRNTNEAFGIELVDKKNADKFTINEILEMNSWPKFAEVDLTKCKEAAEDE